MKKIYIVLSQTGTFVSKAIQWHTKDPYNHASISFDRDLEIMYSFGRKKRYNPMDNGFIEENFNTGLFPYFPNARCCIIEVEITDNEYNTMYNLVNQFYNNKDIYRYNLIGLFGYVVGVKLARKDHFFCSQFVSYILSNSNCWESVHELTKPTDFLKLNNKKIIYEGRIADFNIQKSKSMILVS